LKRHFFQLPSRHQDLQPASQNTGARLVSRCSHLHLFSRLYASDNACLFGGLYVLECVVSMWQQICQLR